VSLLSVDSIVPLPEWNVMMDNGGKEKFIKKDVGSAVV
jgi:hypothetical protein